MNNRTKKGKDITAVGLLVNILLTSFKFVAGTMGRSTAMIADAFHSLSDIVTDIVVILSVGIAGKPKDKTHDYGHGKVETLAAVIIGGALIIVALKILGTGIIKIIHYFQGDTIVRPGWIALYAAIISIVTKEGLYKYTKKTGKLINSQVIIANAWHHRSDALSSLGVMIGIGGAIILGEKWRILDPIAALGVSLLIIKVGLDICFKGINELTDASLSDEIENKILEVIRSVPGAKFPHSMKTRKIGNRFAIDIHIKVDKSLNITEAHQIATEVEEKIKKLYGKSTFILVHVEPFD